MSYRFLKDEKTHVHQILEDGNWKNLHGTSTVSKSVVDKSDFLIPWAVKLAVEYVREHAEEVFDDASLQITPKTLEEAKLAHKSSKDKSATKGTDMHALLEEYVKACIKTKEGQPITAWEAEEYKIIGSFIEWSIENVDRFLFSEANCYSARLWLGGEGDVGFIMKDGRRVLGDFKSSPKAYTDHFIQCALYDIQMAENGLFNRQGERIGDWTLADGYCVFPFRSKPFTPEFVWAAKQYREGAESAVKIYNIIQSRK